MDDIDFKSYRLSFVAHYRFLVGQVIEPYLGARLSLAINGVDGNEIERQRPSLVVGNGAFGVGAAAAAAAAAEDLRHDAGDHG